MHFPAHPRARRFDLVGTLSCVLILAAATAIECGFAMAATTAADDKAKAIVEAPKAEAPKAAAGASVTITSPAAGDTKSSTVTITRTTPDADAPDAKPDSDSTPGKRSTRRRGHIQIGDEDFDSFNDALHTAPWVVGLAFLVAGSILLTPVFLLIGVVWYKLRKTRLQNDALLKLAERGVMPPAQAVDALMSGVSPQAAAASRIPPMAASTAAPVYEQAIIARRRAVWSDLRKGIIFTAVGLSFVFYSMLDSGSANWLGLVLVFLGVGYILLWWFEDRHLQGREGGAGVDVGKS